MIESVAYWSMAIATLFGAVCLVLGLFGVKVNAVSLALTGLVELIVIAQVFVAIVLLANGEQTRGSLFEFFGYQLVAFVIPAAGALFAVAEKSKNSTIVLGLANLTIAIMLFRMLTIWNA